MKKIELALESFKNIQELIRFTDQKASAVLVLTGLVITVFLHYSKNLFFVTPEKSSTIELLVFLSGSLTLFGLTLVAYYTMHKILKPRLAKHYNDNESSVFYFEHIAKMGKSAMATKYSALEEETMLSLVLDQQYEVSKVLEKKIKALNTVFILLFNSIITLLIFIALTRFL